MDKTDSTVTTDAARIALAQYAVAQIGDLLQKVLDDREDLDETLTVALLCRCDELATAASRAFDDDAYETETLRGVIHRGGV